MTSQDALLPLINPDEPSFPEESQEMTELVGNPEPEYLQLAEGNIVNLNVEHPIVFFVNVYGKKTESFGSFTVRGQDVHTVIDQMVEAIQYMGKYNLTHDKNVANQVSYGEPRAIAVPVDPTQPPTPLTPAQLESLVPPKAVLPTPATPNPPAAVPSSGDEEKEGVTRVLQIQIMPDGKIEFMLQGLKYPIRDSRGAQKVAELFSGELTKLGWNTQALSSPTRYLPEQFGNIYAHWRTKHKNGHVYYNIELIDVT